jgi:crotonobetainyl-CoA:carnitine CoA-transferase CaiB-like acyl-CoA transferase
MHIHEFTSLVTGPSCAMALVDMGADTTELFTMAGQAPGPLPDDAGSNAMHNALNCPRAKNRH